MKKCVYFAGKLDFDLTVWMYQLCQWINCVTPKAIAFSTSYSRLNKTRQVIVEATDVANDNASPYIGQR